MTGLGLILAAYAVTASASGWDCATDAKGEWLCQAAAPGSAGADIATGGSGEGAEIDPGTGALLPPVGIAAGGGKKPAPLRLTRLSDDWVSLDKLTEAQRQEGDNKICCGAYVDPSVSGDLTDPDGAPIRAHADQTQTDMVAQTTTLSGDVQIRQGYRYLRADQAVINKNPQQVSLAGNVELREPGLLLLSDSGRVMVDDKTAAMDDVQYLLHEKHVHGDADSLTRSETGVISMINATYTYCPVDDRQWHLETSSLTLDPNDAQGRARNVTLRVGEVPVFYTPYLQFPLGSQRMSGFLVPSFGLGEDGFDLQTPYYFNLAPNYDLVMTPRYITDRGLMLGSHFRHMSERTRTDLIANVLPGDSDANRDIDSDRWYFSAKQTGADERWESLVDVTAVSDDEYFSDFSNSGLRSSSRSQLRKEAQFDYLPDNWRVGIEAKDFQTLSDSMAEPHNMMPSLFADGAYQLGGAEINLHHRITEFGHQDEGEFQDRIAYDIEQTEYRVLTGSRYNLDYNVAYPLRAQGAFFTPKVGMRHVTQQLDGTNDSILLREGTDIRNIKNIHNQYNMGFGDYLPYDVLYTGSTPDSNPSATVGYASLDSGLVFERDSQWFGKGYRQTLEPRLFYYYAGQQDQEDMYNFDSNNLSFSYAQLFRDYRLAGEDYIEDANQVSAGVSTRFLDPKTGRELVRASIGQAYYLSKRDIVLENTVQDTEYEQNRSHSSIVAEVAARLNRYWDIRTEALWNDDKSKSERETVALRYRDDERRLFNVGYQFLDREPSVNDDGDLVDRSVEQTYVSAAYPLGNQWSLIGHWNHDITNSRELETIAGVEYESCCWSTRIVARRWAVNKRFIDDVDDQGTDNGIFLQVQFKGLGNFGDSLEGMLSDAIFGFEDRNKPLD